MQQALPPAPEATVHLLHVVDVPFELQMRAHGADESTIAYHTLNVFQDSTRDVLVVPVGGSGR